MGATARAIAPAARTRTRLSLVPSRPRRSAAASAAAAKRSFTMFALLVIVVSVLSVGRVWLSVQATEASMKAYALRSDIKTERYEGDMLEVRQSALGSPSRINAIAGGAMNMAPARKVTYLDLTGPAVQTPVRTKDTAGSGLEAVVERVMDLTAGEAEVLLVGDVGLASLW